MAFRVPTAIEIDKKLQDDFRRQARQYGIAGDGIDPILLTLFRTLAGQIETLYAETEKNREKLLDEIIEGLGLDRRRARAAQTLVRFHPEYSEEELVEAGTELTGEASSGERLTFTTDAAVRVSRARVALALVYQDGEMRLLPGPEYPDDIQSARPSLEPVGAELGPNPAIYLAIENLPQGHLSEHGFYFDTSVDAAALRRAMQTETWCLAEPEGTFPARGILRPRRGNAGLRRLDWLLNERSPSSASDKNGSQEEARRETPALPEGYYASRVFLFPSVPPERRWLCRFPRAMQAALEALFGPAASDALSTERAWLKISLPAGMPPLVAAVNNVQIHAVTASNAECLNQTVEFDDQGASIPISAEGGAKKFLVAPLSILGERGTAYLHQFAPSADPEVGRYIITNGRLDITPALHADNTRDRYANVRLWLTGGQLGNRVGADSIQSFLIRGAAPAVRIENPTGAAGGANGETFQQAKARFASALLSRDRVVTEADLETVVRAFDRRVQDVDLSLAVERKEGALQRVHRVRCLADRAEFTDPEQEGRILAADLEDHLRERLLFDVGLTVSLEWK